MQPYRRSKTDIEFSMGQFQQEAHMSYLRDQRGTDMAISVHEGLAIGIFAIECWGRYTDSRLIQRED